MRKADFARAWDILRNFLVFGCFTFGGGWSIMAQIQKVYVEKKHWITDEELLDYTSVGRSTPGLMIGNVSVLFGYHAAGLPGAFGAILGISIPPLIIMIGVTAIYSLIRDNVFAASAMMGVRAAVPAIILSALVKLFKTGMKDLFCYMAAITAFILALFTGISNVILVIIGAAAGFIYMEARTRHGIS